MVTRTRLIVTFIRTVPVLVYTLSLRGHVFITIQKKRQSYSNPVFNILILSSGPIVGFLSGHVIQVYLISCRRHLQRLTPLGFSRISVTVKNREVWLGRGGQSP
jgi:hypothetical protein